MSLFITFEGVEGSGKTTQIRRLKSHLSKMGVPCAITREPGGCPISEEVRKILLNPNHRGMAPLTELLLYEAARAQHVEEVIAPLLKKGTVVISDRFSDASIAYQGYGRKVSLRLIDTLNRVSSQNTKPDVTILLDCPPRVGLKRALQRNQALRQEKEGRFELEEVRFHHRVRRGYLAVAKKEPRRFKIIDTRQGEEKVFQKIQKVIDELIKSRKFRNADFGIRNKTKRTLRTPN